MEEKFCPLLSGFRLETPCRKECAWYNRTLGLCGVAVLADRARRSILSEFSEAEKKKQSGNR